MKFNIKLWGLTCLLVLLCVSFVNATLYINGTETKDIITYYKPNNITTTLIDNSLGTYNATLTGALVINDMIYCDGSDDEINSNVNYATLDDFSYSFYLQKNVASNYPGSGTSPYAVLGTRKSDDNAYAEFNFQHNSAGGSDSLNFNLRTAANSYRAVYTTLKLTTSDWYYIVVTRKGTQVDIWVNGTNQSTSVWFQDDTNNGAGTVNTGSTFSICSGSAGGSATQFTNINITRIAIFNRTLSPTEISYLNAQGITYNFLTEPPGNPITVNSIAITPAEPNEFTDLTVTANVTGGINATLNCSDEGGILKSIFYPSISYNTTTILETATRARYNVTCNITVLNGTWVNSKLSNTVYINFTTPTISAINITADYITLADTIDSAYWDAQNLTCYANVTGSNNVTYNWYKNNNLIIYDYCYQESANTTNQSGTDGTCGILSYSGYYYTSVDHWTSLDYVIDGNWSTYGFSTSSASDLYSIYNIPDFVISAKLTFKFSSGTFNVTVPFDCINKTKKNNLTIYTVSDAGLIKSYFQCLNSSSEEMITLYNGAVLSGKDIYEEAIWWNVNMSILNSSFYSIYDNVSCKSTAYNGTGISNTVTRNITILPPKVNYVNILNSTSLFKQNLTCNYSITHPDNYSVDWLFDSIMPKNNSDTFSTDDYTNLLLGKNVTCRLNSTVLSQSYTRYNTSSNSFIVGQRIVFTANLSTNKTGIAIFNITYSLGTFNTTNYNVTILNYDTTEEYTFKSPDYQAILVNLTTNVPLQYYIFSPYRARTINVSFYDAESFGLLNDRNVTLQIFSSTNDSYYNYSTETGYIFAELLEPLTYQFKSSASGYQDNYLYYTVLPESYTNKKIYMVNSSVKVTYTVIDDSTQVKEGITIKMAKYNTVLSAWVYIQECTTNDVGTCSFYVNEPDTFRYYLFNSNGDLVYFVSNELVDYSSRVFIIPTTSTTFPIFDKCQYVKNHLYYPKPTYSNTTNAYNFTMSMAWTDAAISRVCMKLYIQNSTRSAVFDECIYYSAQSQLYKNNVLLQNKTYTLEWYAITNGEYCVVNYLSIDLRSNETGSSDLFWYFITAVLLIFGTSVGVMLRSPELTMLVDLIILTGCNILFALSISYAAIFGLWIIAGIIYWKRNA